MPTTKDKKISEKSTKQELWSAYVEAVEQIQGAEIVTHDDNSVNGMIKKLSETKININSEFDTLTKSLLGDLGELYETSEKIRHNKIELLKNFESQKAQLQTAINEVKAKWSESEKKLEEEFKLKKIDMEIAHLRLEEEYKYNIEMSRKKDNDIFNADKLLREKILSEQEQSLAARKNEIVEMEKKIADMPALIAKEIKLAEDALAKELDTKYQAQIKDLTISMAHEKNIADIHVLNLQTTIKKQNEEIISLKSQQSKLNDMMKDMAISALEAKKPTVLSSKSTEEK